MLLTIPAVVSVRYENLCFNQPDASAWARLPPLTVKLEPLSDSSNSAVSVAPHHVFMHMLWHPADTYCLGVYPSSRGLFVIGANAMLGQDVVLDVQRRRVGFAPSLCVAQEEVVPGEAGVSLDERMVTFNFMDCPTL